MNRCAYQQKVLALGARGGEMRSEGDSIHVSDVVVCPKPRRIGIFNSSIKDDDHIGASIWRSNHLMESCQPEAGTELLDIILPKGTYGAEKSIAQVDSSPPFFCGSPPSRASNPMIQDVQFGNQKFSPLSPAPEALPSPSARKSGCILVKYGHKPAAVRIEGFSCEGNCSISAVA